jgi:hypothetical protein
MSNKTILLISFLVPMIIGTAAGGMGYLQRYGNPLPPWLGAREIIFGLLGIALLGYLEAYPGFARVELRIPGSDRRSALHREREDRRDHRRGFCFE